MYWCGKRNRWYASNTEYEVIIPQKGISFVIARCNQLGFDFESEEVIPCVNFIKQQSLPHCRNITGMQSLKYILKSLHNFYILNVGKNKSNFTFILSKFLSVFLK